MECWNCKQDTMAPDESVGKDWQRCSACGATDNPPLPRISQGPPELSAGQKATLAWARGKR